MIRKSPPPSPTTAQALDSAAPEPDPKLAIRTAHASPPDAHGSASQQPRPPLNRSSHASTASDETPPLNPLPGPPASADAPAADSASASSADAAGESVAVPPRSATTARPPPTPVAAELDRLKQAVHAKMVLSQQRAKLSSMGGAPPSPKSMGARRVSPIKEESSDAISPSLDAAFSSPIPTGSLTTSTESTESSKTVRGSVPATPAQMPLRTPSYPFPYVPGTPRTWSSSFHQPFTTLSPTVGAMDVREPGTPRDRQLSSVSTPLVSAASFMPPGATMQSAEDPQYPTPNLYDLTLLLSSEPGLDAWWKVVTNIMRDWYGAERVTLAVPADPTDIENVPWGQKASFNLMGAINRTSSFKATEQLQGKDGRVEETKAKEGKFENVDIFQQQQQQQQQELSSRRMRPKLESRHSFAGHERTKKDTVGEQRTSGPPPRPRGPTRTASHTPHVVGQGHPMTPQRDVQSSDHPSMPNHQRLKESTFSDPDFSSVGEDVPKGPYWQVFPVLRALDHEPQALIDNSGINRVLERGKLVTLTRDYSSIDGSRRDSGAHSSKGSRGSPETQTANRPQATPKAADIRSRAGNASHFASEDFYRFKLTTQYEEYEQYPSSPWAQSPAPSPAIQANPNENPFFAAANVDEESFNPQGSGSGPDYSAPVEAIGVDRASTVTHLPLIHPILSQVMQPFETETPAETPAESRFSTVSSEPAAPRKAPIAILSMLSPMVPYPQNLTQSLKLIAPHLATTFSNGLHYSSAHRTAAGTRHRRYGSGQTTGFGATPGDAESLDDLIHLDIDVTDSATGSITSPSEYSVRSKNSPGGSIAGTPGWDHSAMGFSSSKHSVGNTPGHILGSEAVDSYFDAKKKMGPSRGEATLRPSGGTPPPMDQRTPGGRKVVSILPTEEEDVTPRLDQPPTSQPQSKDGKQQPSPEAKASGSPTRATHARRLSLHLKQDQGRADQRHHSLLHSYGADFSSSFQSLPAATTPVKTPGAQFGHGRAPSIPERQDMPPPSERLLRTIIDSLPVQVFTAAPSTGALTWVNTKFLVYRGQDCRQILQEPWEGIHPDDRPEYMSMWSRCLRTGQQFQQKVRVRRFDGNYRWFYVRAAPLKDKRQNIVHWIGTNMDVHDQHLAEINASRQQETAASEAKYRALANSSPQIVFAVNKRKGITFCNSQWLSYSGQTEEDALGLGFMDYVHPEDLVKCRLPAFDKDGETPKNVPLSMPSDLRRSTSASSGSIFSDDSSTNRTVTSPGGSTPSTIHMPQTRLSKLADTGILKVTRDSDGRPSYSTEVRLRSKDGTYHWHLVRILLAEPVLQGEEEEETWYGTCTDINDHKLLEQTLKETMDAKSRFLSNMSHEIRTPLNGITGMVNFLIDSNLTSEQMEHVNIIRNSTEGLRDLINDILDLSKVEAGMITLAMDWMHVRSLIEEVNDLTSAMAINKGLELNYIVEEDVPSMVKGDRFRIRQVLLNVVGNAIKFTQRGEVFVRCRIAENQEVAIPGKESLVQFDVIDTGSGFTEKEAEFLFKRFSQIDGSSTRQHGGTGLGLAISMQLVELHGGKMKASSVPGKGSTFTFTIKFTLPSEAEQPPPEAHSPTATTMPPPETGATLSPSPIETLKSPARFTESPKPSSASSSASSDPSVRTGRTSVPSTRSSTSSFSSTANAANMKLSLPADSSSKREDSANSSTSSDTARAPSTSVSSPRTSSPLAGQPPMYSILVVCPLAMSRDATVRHIEMTLPKAVPAQITARDSAEECRRMISGEDPVIFTHIVLVLHDSKEVISFIDQVFHSQPHSGTSVIIISDLVQKREVMAEASAHDYDKLTDDRRLRFVFKPLKPSKFAVIFDPQKEREISTDRNENSAQQVAVNQKMVFDDMKRRLGNKGHRVLLVEDNKINQTVLLKLLGKTSINVETVLDGVECTDKVFSKEHGYYSIILCDLHMPNKDGYQTCKEIRQWEKKNSYPHLPIIALSANVLGDVYSKCVEAGFNSYVTKPVDFKELSAVMTRFLDPPDPAKPHEFMRPRKE
ncbi:Peroxide stress-activated histidine kinase mak1 [Lasiodiplodia theobromae]|uniref:histidine kinase n=1 Tax=Lasiodiplodia theobromae TaxID=45133 RepID=A0A5N5DPZ4_9PEZI|nr:Peroxide stress-activated histidine kinase mak1 [Lasiodiplodia theobromae]